MVLAGLTAFLAVFAIYRSKINVPITFSIQKSLKQHTFSSVQVKFIFLERVFLYSGKCWKIPRGKILKKDKVLGFFTAYLDFTPPPLPLIGGRGGHNNIIYSKSKWLNTEPDKNNLYKNL